MHDLNLTWRESREVRSKVWAGELFMLGLLERKAP
jgi:hypothetical protein